MRERPELMKVLCVENLHEFEIPSNSIDVFCPFCGCTFIRAYSNESTMAETRIETNIPYLESSPPSWLDSLGLGGQQNGNSTV